MNKNETVLENGSEKLRNPYYVYSYRCIKKRDYMKLFIILSFTFIFISCTNSQNKGMDYKDMFEKALKIVTTSPNYLVVIIIDLNTSNEKEICCESIDLSYALSLDSVEMSLDSLKYNKNGIPVFEIKSKRALEQLRFYQYNIETVDSLFKHSTNDLIENILIENRESGYSKLLELNTTKFTENYFEHFLFRKEIFTYRDCESGYTVIMN
jgi:hypothetical protein